MPFSDVRLLSYLQHTYWFLPSVAACKAMERLMARPVNHFYHDYEVVVAAGNEAGMGAEAVLPVYEAMNRCDGAALDGHPDAAQCTFA